MGQPFFWNSTVFLIPSCASNSTHAFPFSIAYTQCVYHISDLSLFNAWVIHCAGIMIFSIISINITFKTKWSPVYFCCSPFCAGSKASWMLTHAEMPHLTTGFDKLNDKFQPQSGNFCFLEKALTAFRLNAFNDPCYGHSAGWTALTVSFCPLAWSKLFQQFKLSRP